MRKLLWIILIINVCSIVSPKAQPTSTVDGILINSASLNSNTYYYGETINIYFEFSNTTNQTKRYHKPYTGINLIFYLKNKTTNKTIEPRLGFWSAGEHSRIDMQREAPPVNEAYQPHEYGQYVVQINEQFGTESLSQVKVSSNHDLGDRLSALPVGDYELELKYYPYPLSQEVIVTFPFKVIALPIEEKEAFKKYVQATVYACNAHFWAGKNYSSSHKDSYENLIKSHPNSLFAQYAFLDMVREIYSYAGPNESAKAAKFKEYISFYPNIKKSNLKMDYLRFLPEYVLKIPGVDTKKHLDKVLYSLKDDHPAYSRGLIRNAELRHKIKGLKNYSGKKL